MIMMGERLENKLFALALYITTDERYIRSVQSKIVRIQYIVIWIVDVNK